MTELHRPLTLGLAEAAKLLRIHPNTLREQAASGKVPGAKPGRSWIFLEEDLLAHIRGQYAARKALPCLSTSAKVPMSGGSISDILDSHGYVGQLDTLIARKPKRSITKSR